MFHTAVRFAACLLLACTLLGCHAEVPVENTPTQPAEAQPLPKVLLIGDSISQGYRATVVKELEGVADVTRIPGNGEWTGNGVEKIDAWLGDTDWDVIHFNFGLWDMYGWPYYDEDRSPEAYAKRLEQIVTRLEKTNAKLIWATTTPPCPDNEVSMRDRFKKPGVVTVENEQQYLAAAERVMKKHKIQINDLNALVPDDIATLHTGPDNVHFTGKGNTMLGKQVAEAIRTAIGQR